MTIEITPRGTKGSRIPGFLRPFMRFGMRQMAGRFRRSGGTSTMRGQPLLLLTTIGARTGQRRANLLARFPDGDSERSWLITATGMGTAAHPAWFINIAAHPDQVWVEIEGKEIHVRPEQLRGAVRDAAYQRIVELNPSFRGYPTQTDREIPVLRLSAIEGAP